MQYHNRAPMPGDWKWDEDESDSPIEDIKNTDTSSSNSSSSNKKKGNSSKKSKKKQK
jgi:hypothetical protein